MLDVLAHLELEEDEMPRAYTLLRVEVPGDLGIEEIELPPSNEWKMDHTLSRRPGDEWLARRTAALACVPSPNYVLNPLHPDAARIRIAEATERSSILRLLRRLL